MKGSRRWYPIKQSIHSITLLSSTRSSSKTKSPSTCLRFYSTTCRTIRSHANRKTLRRKVCYTVSSDSGPCLWKKTTPWMNLSVYSCYPQSFSWQIHIHHKMKKMLVVDVQTPWYSFSSMRRRTDVVDVEQPVLLSEVWLFDHVSYYSFNRMRRLTDVTDVQSSWRLTDVTDVQSSTWVVLLLPSSSRHPPILSVTCGDLQMSLTYSRPSILSETWGGW
jgi:hypothetical protein